jgi:hypothetical protein
LNGPVFSAIDCSLMLLSLVKPMQGDACVAPAGMLERNRQDAAD